MNDEVLFCLKETVQTKAEKVLLKDICSVNGADMQQVGNIVFDLRGRATEITALDVAAVLKMQMPACSPVNMGPPKCTVFRLPRPTSAFVRLVKSAFLCVVMFFGGAIAIMTFHEDVSMRAVHSRIYEFFTGESTEFAPIVSIPYSAGIAIGLIVIFGLLRRKKAKPTVLDLDIHEQEKAMDQYISDKEAGGNG